MSPVVLSLLGLGCAPAAGPPPPGGGTMTASDGELSAAGFAGLEDDASWTWRDDDADTLDLDRVIHGRHEGEGYVALRRGGRWADAQEIGHLAWTLEGGLGLTSWALDDAVGDSQVLLLTDGTGWGGNHQDGDWSCTASENVPVDSWYGLFEDGLMLECSGSGGLAGSYAFAWNRGLVGFRGKAFALDLVSPFG